MVTRMLRGASGARRLVKLGLKLCQFRGTESWAAILGALPGLQDLKEFHLNHNKIGQAEAQSLAGVLPGLPKFERLNLQANNIEQVGDNQLRITLAVAGFSEEDLSIELEDNQLVIRGQQTDDQNRVFLHQGIAARQFLRNFVLADGIEVNGAHLDNGLLHIELARPAPESRVRTIEIASAPPGQSRNRPLKIDEVTQGGE